MRRAVGFLCCIVPLAALIPTGVSASAFGADQKLFTWWVQDRYGGDADGDGRLDPDGSHLARALALHPVRVVTSACKRPVWRVDGRRRAVVMVTLAGEKCAGTLHVRGEGDHTIELRSGGRREAQTARVIDRLVVVIGDSVAAGEGNPRAAPGPAWAERRCHRRDAAAGERAARRVMAAARQRDGRFGITFVSLACSGATIDQGLLGEYAGQEPAVDDRLLDPQIDRLRRLDLVNPASAVILSVGANDIHFGPLVIACARLESCPDKAASLDGKPKRKIVDAVNADLVRLPKGYEKLAKQLGPIVGPRRVIVTKYFDPTRGDDGQLCRSSGIGLDAGEFAFASRSVLAPLNAAVAAAARKHGWQLVSGVPRDFVEHGYCARDRWVVRLRESVLTSRGSRLLKRALGTLHPNVKGQLAISQRIDALLASTLGVESSSKPRAPISTSREARDSAGKPWWRPRWYWLAIVAAIILVWPGLVTLSRRRLGAFSKCVGQALFVRPVWLALPDATHDPMTARVSPPPWSPATCRGLAIVIYVATGVSLLGSGFAIEHVRLAAARLSASGASYVDRWTLQSGPRIMWTLIALVVAGIVFMRNRDGTATRVTRRWLSFTLIAGLGATILWIQDFSAAQERELIIALLVLVGTGHYLVDRVLRLTKRSPSFGKFASEAWTLLRGKAGWLTAVWRTLPLIACLYAIRNALDATTGLDRFGLVVGPLALAAILMVARGGIAAGARSRAGAQLRPARDILAVTTFAAVLILFARTQPYLVVTGAVGGVLAVACVFVAARSGTHFAPLGAAVVAAVLLFAAFEEGLEEYRAPKAQGVAALTADRTLVCGFLLGKRDDELAVAEVSLDDRGRASTPHVTPTVVRLRGLLAPRYEGKRVPTVQALIDAAFRRDLLARRNPGASPGPLGPSNCPHVPRPADDPANRAVPQLVERFAPTFTLDTKDGFWPIPVSTLFLFAGRDGAACLQRAVGQCRALSRPSDVPWRGSRKDAILPPVRMDRHDEAAITNRALRGGDPADSATAYYLKTRGSGGSMAIQYWMYFTYDYVLVKNLFEAGSHQGDWEHVGVVTSKNEHPRYFWMSRHEPDQEGRPFVWGEPGMLHTLDPSGVARRGDHPRVYTARGSHASYDHCGTQIRDQGPFGLIDENVTCDPGRQMHLHPRLVDLARTPWACFAGKYGRDRKGAIENWAKHLIEDAPRGPLWQQEFDHVSATPCKHVSYTKSRDGITEEVLDEHTADRLRTGAGRLEHWFDDCEDWEKPPTRGSYLVVCDQGALTDYVERGLEGPPPDAPRILGDNARSRARTLPAVRRSLRPGALRTWRIRGKAASATVYAARRFGADRTVAALFTDVAIRPGQTLRVDDDDARWWRLLDNNAEGDAPVAVAPVDTVSRRGVTR